MKKLHEISFNDYRGGISVLLVIPGCSLGCKYCFNKNIWNVETPNFIVYKEIIDKYKKKIKHFVLSGGNICEENNQKVVKEVCDYLYENNLGIHLQINAKMLKDSMSFLEDIPFDSARLSLNEIDDENIQYIDRLMYMCEDITTCFVYLKDGENLSNDVKVDELVVDYNHPELYKEARDYARQKEIPILISSQYGKEIVNV